MPMSAGPPVASETVEIERAIDMKYQVVLALAEVSSPLSFTAWWRWLVLSIPND
jgi:hypothetical protein